MKSIAFKTVTLVGCLATLIASGGGGEVTQSPNSATDSATANGVSSTRYKSLYDVSGTTNGAGSGVSTGNSTVKNSEGTFIYDNATGALTISIDSKNYSLGTPKSTSNGILYHNGSTVSNSTVVALVRSPLIGGTYDYVTDFAIVDSGSPKSVHGGVGGQQTILSEMPTQGTITYSGTAYANYTRYGGTEIDLNNGRSTVVAKFGSGTADVTASNFSTSGTYVDTITGTDMTISGNKLVGGNWTTSKNGTENRLGQTSSSSTFANGGFFGFDSTKSGPDEVGVIAAKYDTNGTGFIVWVLAD